MSDRPPKLYLYAIVHADAAEALGDDLIGVSAKRRAPASPVLVHKHGPIAAVVSPFASGRIRPERRNLKAHNTVLKTILDKKLSMLPFSFGTILPNSDALEELLEHNRDDVVFELKRLGGRVEMGLSVNWDVPNIFEYLLTQNEELALSRDQLLNKPGGITREDQIHIGQSFAYALDQARERDREIIDEHLEPLSVDSLSDPPRRESEVMKLSFLIDWDKRETFENAIISAARHFDDSYQFDINGPWPPFNFVNINLTSPSSA